MRRFILLCGLLIAQLPLTAMAATDTTPTAINDIHVVLMVLDGCMPDMLYGMIERGKLPAIKRHLVDRGMRFTNAITVFPSATVNAYQSMVTGLFPGHAGIPYLEWFDRASERVMNFFSLKGAALFNARMENYYTKESKTGPLNASIFDDLLGHPTASIYSPFFKHAAQQEPGVPLALLWAGYGSNRPEMMDVYSYRHLMRLFQLPHEQIPRLTFTGLLGTDHIEHRFGVQHPRVPRNLRQFDAFIEEFMQLLERRHLLDRTYIIVTSDHGMHNITGVFDLPTLMQTAGFTLVKDKAQPKANAYVAVRGVSLATVTLKSRRGWGMPVSYRTMRAYPVAPGRTVDVVQRLAEAPETDLVLVRESRHRVRVVRGTEEAMLQHHRHHGHSTYSYRAIVGDPLRLTRYPQLRAVLHGQRLSAKTWGQRLRHTDTPGVVPQLTQIFDDGRAGDLVVIAKLPWGFFHHKAATHGTHHAIDMRVPLIIRGPHIAAGVRDYAQVADLYPTMLRWFGLPTRQHSIDGVPLFE